MEQDLWIYKSQLEFSSFFLPFKLYKPPKSTKMALDHTKMARVSIYSFLGEIGMREAELSCLNRVQTLMFRVFLK